MQNFQCLDFFVRIALTDCFPEFIVQLAHRIINVHISPVDHHFGAFFPESKQFQILRIKRNVRVRIHGSLARIEIMPEEFPKLLEKNVREDIAKKFKEYGFTYVTMDILGYRMGSMNETLGENDKTTADSSLKGKNE